MKLKYAVGHIDFFNNDLKIEVVAADSVKEALSKHSAIGESKEVLEWLDSLPEDLESIKEEFFNADQCVDVVEL